MEKKRNILIADDEKEIISLLRLFLEKENINVYEAYDGEMAYMIISLLRLFLEKENINVYEAYDGEMAYMIMEHYEIDLAILDIMMPRMNGFEVIKKLRQKYNIPVMILSAKVALDDKVYGLEVGADDYITKPFEPLEVVARVKAHFRRNDLKAENGNTDTFSDSATNTASDRLIRYNDMVLNLDSCQFSVGDNVMDLTKIEFNIMEMFMNSPGRVFTKEQIFERGWDDSFVDDNTIRVTISRLRDKIGNDRIKTIRGLGYRLESK